LASDSGSWIALAAFTARRAFISCLTNRALSCGAPRVCRRPFGLSYAAMAPLEAFSKFPMPRNTEVFGPTFNGEGIVRSDDIM
jgi:hypothetical protein